MSDASFARTLAVALKQRSQVAVAAALGVSPQLVSDWKRGRRRPPPGQVFALERVLATEPGMLSRHLGFVPVDAEDAAATGITDQVRERVAALLGDPLPELEQLVPDMDDFTSRAAARGFGLELLRLAVDDFEREGRSARGNWSAPVLGLTRRRGHRPRRLRDRRHGPARRAGARRP